MFLRSCNCILIYNAITSSLKKLGGIFAPIFFSILIQEAALLYMEIVLFLLFLMNLFGVSGFIVFIFCSFSHKQPNQG